MRLLSAILKKASTACDSNNTRHIKWLWRWCPRSVRLKRTWNKQELQTEVRLRHPWSTASVRAWSAGSFPCVLSEAAWCKTYSGPKHSLLMKPLYREKAPKKCNGTFPNCGPGIATYVNDWASSWLTPSKVPQIGLQEVPQQASALWESVELWRSGKHWLIRRPQAWPPEQGVVHHCCTLMNVCARPTVYWWFSPNTRTQNTILQSCTKFSCWLTWVVANFPQKKLKKKKNNVENYLFAGWNLRSMAKCNVVCDDHATKRDLGKLMDTGNAGKCSHRIKVCRTLGCQSSHINSPDLDNHQDLRTRCWHHSSTCWLVAWRCTSPKYMFASCCIFCTILPAWTCEKICVGNRSQNSTTWYLCCT